MKRLMVILPAVLASSLAFGQGEGQGGKLDLSTLKEKCAELTANQQIKPPKVQITCSEISHVWKPAKGSQKLLPNTREVGASARMKNFEVPYFGIASEIEGTTTDCAVLERYKETVPAVDVELTCEQLEQIQDLNEFCTPKIDERVQQDPGIVLSEKTGEIYNTCSGIASGK
jgi:hypothetical protein